MTLDEFNSFCATLPATTHVVQWRGADVWKVGDKLVAIGRIREGQPGSTFKVTELGFEVLSEMPGLRPAPHLASRGLKWIQHYGPPGLSDDALKAHITASHEMAVARLTRKARAALGL